MPTTTAKYRRNEDVVARQNLPGVPAGTGGQVMMAVGLTWERYRVQFDNGVQLGSIDAEALASPTDEGIDVHGAKPESERFEPLAIWSLIASIFVGLGSLIAVILGHRALACIEQNERRGMGIAIAGLFLGYIGLTAVFFAIVGLFAG